MINEPAPERHVIKNITPNGEHYADEAAPLIVVKQLPVIEERLKSIKEQAEARVQAALSLVVTEDTLVSVKEVRAELRKEYARLEEDRKAVKRAILAPCDAFEVAYKECITNVFGPADAQLKTRIDEVEEALKEEVRAEVAEYFYEYLASKGIDFIDFVDAGIHVTRSVSKKKLKEQAKAFVDRICEDLSIIDVQEDKDEILYHYKKYDGGCYLNASRAIQVVAQKNRAIEEAKAREAELKAKQEAQQKAAEKVEAVVEALAPPTVVEPLAESEKQTRYEVSFKVATYDLEKIRKLKAFMEKEGIEYEQI